MQHQLITAPFPTRLLVVLRLHAGAHAEVDHVRNGVHRLAQVLRKQAVKEERRERTEGRQPIFLRAAHFVDYGDQAGEALAGRDEADEVVVARAVADCATRRCQVDVKRKQPNPWFAHALCISSWIMNRVDITLVGKQQNTGQRGVSRGSGRGRESRLPCLAHPPCRGRTPGSSPRPSCPRRGGSRRSTCSATLRASGWALPVGLPPSRPAGTHCRCAAP